MYVEIKIPTVYESALARLCLMYRINSLFVWLVFMFCFSPFSCNLGLYWKHKYNLYNVYLEKIHETFMLNHVNLHVACCTQAELMKAAHEEKCSLLVQYLSGSFYWHHENDLKEMSGSCCFFEKTPVFHDLPAGISPRFASLFSKKPPPRTPDKCDPDLSFDAVAELQQEVLFFKDRYVNCPTGGTRLSSSALNLVQWY